MKKSELKQIIREIIVEKMTADFKREHDELFGVPGEGKIPFYITDIQVKRPIDKGPVFIGDKHLFYAKDEAELKEMVRKFVERNTKPGDPYGYKFGGQFKTLAKGAEAQQWADSHAKEMSAYYSKPSGFSGD
jgi:hypothetical protein